MGHVLTNDGLKPDPEKVKSIKDMPIPEDKKGMKRFLGTVNYLSKFIPNLSQVAVPLRELTKDGTNFVMSTLAVEAVEKLKNMISEDVELRYFDVKKPVVIECDASYSGLGAVMMQDNKPVSYASRTLTETERKYHPIELECLSVLFACTKFDQYIYGKQDVKVYSDHQPLQSIFKKEMDKSPLRLQKMLLTLQRYGFDLQYRPGSDQIIADMLSRAPLTEGPPTAEQNENKVEVFYNSIDDSDPSVYSDLKDCRIQALKKHNAENHTMQLLIDAITKGWPTARKECSEHIQDFWTFREEMAYRDGLLYKGTRMVIPETMVDEICEALHAAHQGAEAMLHRARDILYWPGMGKDVERWAQNCSKCLELRPVNQKEPLLVHETPRQPFTKVGTDICFYQQAAYLIIVDYTTDYIEAEKLVDQSADEVIDACKRVFARHGRPVVVHSDNGPQYISAEFKTFAKQWCFKHTTSSPYTPRSNGKAESAVKIFKRILKSCSDPMRGLMEWRASPNKDFASPSERLFSRRIRTLIPIDDNQLEPKQSNLDELKKQRENRQVRMQQSYDKSAKDLSALHVGQPVMLQTVNDKTQKWREARVLEKLTNRSYLVDKGDGIVRRNRQMLRKRPEESQKLQGEEDNDIEGDNQDKEIYNSNGENGNKLPSTLRTRVGRRP